MPTTQELAGCVRCARPDYATTVRDVKRKIALHHRRNERAGVERYTKVLAELLKHPKTYL